MGLLAAFVTVSDLTHACYANKEGITLNGLTD